MKTLVVGGAGYIGSHTARQLTRAGHEVLVLDSFQNGHHEAVAGIPSVTAQLSDVSSLEQILDDYNPDAVIHFAALIEVGESMRDPAAYYANNVSGSLNVLRLLAARKIPVVFSSTAAVYGTVDQLIDEDTPTRPESVYGRTKLMTEDMIRDFHAAYGLPYIILRYFNVCGAAPEGDIGEAHPSKTHLIELACLTALGQREQMMIFGEDYPTPDGTCIRDYIHVQDLAAAHVLAVEALGEGKMTAGTYNVGLGRGFSVREVLSAVEGVVGRSLPIVSAPRRAGDPPFLVADGSKIVRELGFAPQFTDLSEMVRTAWVWHSTHPEGYGRK